MPIVHYWEIGLIGDLKLHMSVCHSPQWEVLVYYCRLTLDQVGGVREGEVIHHSDLHQFQHRRDDVDKANNDFPIFELQLSIFIGLTPAGTICTSKPPFLTLDRTDGSEKF